LSAVFVSGCVAAGAAGGPIAPRDAVGVTLAITSSDAAGGDVATLANVSAGAVLEVLTSTCWAVVALEVAHRLAPSERKVTCWFIWNPWS